MFYLSASFPPSPLFTGGRAVPGQLTAIITYPSAGIFWQPVELSQVLGFGRDGLVGGEGRSLCSRVTLVPSSAVFGSEHLGRSKWAEAQAPGSFLPHCPLPPSHILMMNMATDPCSPLFPIPTELLNFQSLLSCLLLTSWAVLSHSRNLVSLNQSFSQRDTQVQGEILQPSNACAKITGDFVSHHILRPSPDF